MNVLWTIIESVSGCYGTYKKFMSSAVATSYRRTLAQISYYSEVNNVFVSI